MINNLTLKGLLLSFLILGTTMLLKRYDVVAYELELLRGGEPLSGLWCEEV